MCEFSINCILIDIFLYLGLKRLFSDYSEMSQLQNYFSQL